jgi:sigma54-dependent transcription regulator
MQLEAVIKVCRQSKSLSYAGHADRLKKYLSRSGLSWHQLSVPNV